MKIAVLLVVLLGACGDKLPESEKATALGNAPKQTMERAATGVDNAMQQGTDRIKDADKKQ